VEFLRDWPGHAIVILNDNEAVAFATAVRHGTA